VSGIVIVILIYQHHKPIDLILRFIYISSLDFPIQNGLKQGEALSPLLLNFVLEYAIRRSRQTSWD
jgi:hypothetical protein